MPDPPARRSRRSAGSLQAHRGREGVAAAGLQRPGKVFGQFQYLTPPVHGSDARQQEIADSLSKLAREELKRGSKGTGRQGSGKRSGTQRARNRKQAS
jgi:hypothetical protein